MDIFTAKMSVGDLVAGIAYTVGMGAFVVALVLVAYVFGGTI